MLKKCLLLNMVLFVLASTTVLAQRVCPSHDILHQQMKDNPEMEHNRQNIEEFTKHFEQTFDNNGRAVYNIPVVVHVVYKTAVQNISDAQVQSQIDVLNADFQLLNGDNTLVGAAFAPFKANVDVSFCLAKQDPNGAATNGITRTSTTVSSFATNDAIKKASTGGKDPWNTAKYLNLWVAPAMNGGVLGYAQFPGGAAATDGVVIANTCFGKIGTVTSPYNLGRTATHEVGHWLNLFHIWGDDGTACTGSDNVTDTPNQAGEHYGTFPAGSVQTDGCSAAAPGTMWMNYMDYTNDIAMYMFTNGQKTRMQAVLASGGARAGLATSLGCTAPTGGGTTCAAPSGLTNASLASTSVTLSWGAVTGATSYSLQYKTSAATAFTTVAVTGTSYALSGLTASTAYNWQVKSVCSATLSSAFTAATFTTLAATPACVDNYESNNTITTAKAITVGSSINALIGTSTDIDYFSFSNSATAKNIKVTMTATKDYDLYLYNAAGNLVASASTATLTETLKYNNTLAAGKYYIKVVGYNSAFSATACYTLKAETSAATWRQGSTGPDVVDFNDSMVKVMPNPATDDLRIVLDEETFQGETTLRMVDQMGRTIIAQDLDSSESRLNVANMPNGMYIIQLRRDDVIVNKRVMIQH